MDGCTSGSGAARRLQRAPSAARSMRTMAQGGPSTCGAGVPIGDQGGHDVTKVLAGLVAAMLLAPAAAHAQTVTGGQSDPLGDGLSLDAERVEMTYTRETGQLDVLVRVDPATDPLAFGGRVLLSVGSAVRNGACAA